MYRGYRIVAIVPTKGEKRHTELLLYYLECAGWEKLCPFLGREIPDVPFPRLK
jgi:hypothetical protein